MNQVDADIHHAFEWPPDLDPEGLLTIGGWVDELTRVHSRNSTYSFLHFIAYSDMIGESQIGVVTYTSTSHPWGKESLPPDTNLGGSPSSVGCAPREVYHGSTWPGVWHPNKRGLKPA